MRCVPASAASPAMFTRNAGTSGSTHGERNDRMPAPNAIATFTRLAYLRATVDSGGRGMATANAKATGDGTKAKPWKLKTPLGTSEYQMYRADDADPPA